MKIQKIYIDGFRNLSKVNIDLQDITALVSLNNYGKSNVLTGIDYGIEFIKASPQTKQQMMSNSDYIPLHKLSRGKNYKFEIETLTKLKSVLYRVIYGFEFSWSYNEAIEPKIVAEYLKFKPENQAGKFTNIINRDDSRSLYKSSETGRCASKINIEDTALVVNKLMAFDELYYIDIIKNLNNMVFYMETNLDVKDLYKPDPVIFKNLEDMDLNAKNLPRVIYKLKKNYPDKFELLMYSYQEIFPDIEDIIVEEYDLKINENSVLSEDAPFIISNSVYFLFVKNKNLLNPIDFNALSDGAKRVFMILLRIILSDISNVALVAIEEPENSVHPTLFRSYLSIIRGLLEDCKVIITSHSPYIISYLNPSWINVGISKCSGLAEFHGFKKKGERLLKKDAEKLGYTTGDFLFTILADEETVWEDYLECN